MAKSTHKRKSKPCTTVSGKLWVWCLLCGFVDTFKEYSVDPIKREKRWAKKHTCREVTQ